MKLTLTFKNADWLWERVHALLYEQIADAHSAPSLYDNLADTVRVTIVGNPPQHILEDANFSMLQEG